MAPAAIIEEAPLWIARHRQSCNCIVRQIVHDSQTQRLPRIVEPARRIVGALAQAASTPLVFSETVEDPYDIEKANVFGPHT